MSSVFLLIINSVLLGLGLAMDAFSVSLVNGMNEPHMRKSRMLQVAGTFAGFQFVMPVIGWICVKTIADTFHQVQKFIPWIALILLTFIGGKMLIEGIRGKKTGLKRKPGQGISLYRELQLLLTLCQSVSPWPN